MIWVVLGEYVVDYQCVKFELIKLRLMLSTLKYRIALVLLLICTATAHSQEKRTEMSLDFRVNTTSIDSTYSDNLVRMQEIVDFLRNIRKDSTITITQVSLCGAASPEGSFQINRKLARGRLVALENFIRKEIDVPDSIIIRNDNYIPWDFLKSQISNSSIEHKAEVLSILDEDARLVEYSLPYLQIDNRVVKLKALDGGKVWQQLNRLFFEDMRNACAVFVTCVKEIPADDALLQPEPVSEVDTVQPDTIQIVETEVVETEGWSHRLYLKTNVLGLGMAIANLGVEIDLARHLSLAVPVYYSAWDYFMPTLKFRTFSVQPEFRFWPSIKNDGFFVGAHFGLGYYNFAFDGDYRYQDHDGETPAMGGGVSVGYRLPLRKESHWRVEFSLGAGVYPAHYDIFHNTADVRNGLLTGSEKMTYWGIDQAAVSFSYSFDLKRKGGKR